MIGMVRTTHTLMRELRATARNIQAEVPADLQGLRRAVALWNTETPVAGRRVLALIESAETDLKGDRRVAALGHMRGAIEIVEQVKKLRGV